MSRTRVEHLEPRRLLTGVPAAYAIAYFDKSTPNGGVSIDAEGNLFGVTAAGGMDDDGTVYEIAAGSHALTTLYNFTGGADGSGPAGPLLVDSSGDLFGVTQDGGNLQGTVFELTGAGHAFTTLAQLPSAINGSPNGGLVEDPAGDLFGTTGSDEFQSHGDVFEVSASPGHALIPITVPNFGLGGLTLAADGTIDGISSLDTADPDTESFKITSDAGRNIQVTILDQFETGSGLDTDPLLDAAGDLYYYVSGGGSPSGGALELTPGPNVFPRGIADGVDVPIAFGPSGDLYDATETALGEAVVDLNAKSGNRVSAVSVVGLDSGTCTGRLLVTDDGIIYGTTVNSFSDGCVFEIYPASLVSTTTTRLTASAATVMEGGSITLTATVDPAGGTGIVSFAQDKLSDLDDESLSADGTVSFVVTFENSTPFSTQSFVAGYSGDATHNGSTSATVTVDVLPPPVSTTVYLSDSLPASGISVPSVTFSATVIQGASSYFPDPTGTLTFKSDGVTLNVVDIDTSGKASFTTSSLPEGVYSVTAVYSGDTTYIASTSAAVTINSGLNGFFVGSGQSFSMPAEKVASGSVFDGSFVEPLVSDPEFSVKGAVEIQLYLSADEAIEANDALLLTRHERVSIPAGNSLSLTLRFHALLPTLPVGTYHLLVSVKSPDGNVNVSTIDTLVDIVEPEVALTAVVLPSKFETASDVRFQVVIKSIGNTVASGNVEMTAVLHGDHVTATDLGRYIRHVHLLPGRASVFNLKAVRLKALLFGAYTLEVDVSLASIYVQAVTLLTI